MSDTRRTRIDIAYTLRTTSALHIGSGYGKAGLNRQMLRDVHGQPYIPGSTIKGRVRFASTRLCDWIQLTSCPYSDDEGRTAWAGLRKMAGHDEEVSRLNGPSAVLYLPDRIFGRAWERCRLRFSDARAPNPVRETEVEDGKRLREHSHPWREVRAGAARSRRLGVVSHGRLFHTEVAPAGLELTGSIQGYLDCHFEFDVPIEAMMLHLALLAMGQAGVGGSKSTGGGRLEWSVQPTMMIDGLPFEPESMPDILELLPEWYQEVYGA